MFLLILIFFFFFSSKYPFWILPIDSHFLLNDTFSTCILSLEEMGIVCMVLIYSFGQTTLFIWEKQIFLFWKWDEIHVIDCKDM